MEHPEFTDFIAYLHLKNLAPATIKKYRGVLKRLFDHIDLGPSPPSQITTAQLRDYVASLYERGLAPETIKKCVLVIKRFFGFLLVEGYIEEDPSRRIPTPKVGKRLPRALTVPQVQALFIAMSDETPTEHRDQVFFKLLYTCGLRVGEADRIRVTDINWEDGWLTVIGKGDKERRVYLKPYLVEALREYIEESEVQGYLFPGKGGQGHFSGRHMARRLKRYLEKAGLPGHVTPHALRHSAAVHYLIGGAPITFVQNLLGHESLASTGIYTQLVDQMAKEIALNTKTAIDEIEAMEEGELLKEAPDIYDPEFEGWDDFVGRVLEWFGANQE
jgi:site-specific recombinase XerD